MLRRNTAHQMTPFFQTKDMCHSFNCPFQLSRLPPVSVLSKMFDITNVTNGRDFVVPCMDEPKDAQCFDVDVMEGDLILLATDGLWDNLWPSEIASVANLSLTPLDALLLHDETFETAAHDISRAITEATLIRSKDFQCRTPFADSYTLECGIPAYRGGKWDDITVLSAWVCRKHRTTDGSNVESFCSPVVSETINSGGGAANEQPEVTVPPPARSATTEGTTAAVASSEAESSSSCCCPMLYSNAPPLGRHATRWPYRPRSENDLMEIGNGDGTTLLDSKLFIDKYKSGKNKDKKLLLKQPHNKR